MKIEPWGKPGIAYDPDCDHDWRVNPNVVLTSMPPHRQLLCPNCGARSSAPIEGWNVPSNDPAEWPSYGLD